MLSPLFFFSIRQGLGPNSVSHMHLFRFRLVHTGKLPSQFLLDGRLVKPDPLIFPMLRQPPKPIHNWNFRFFDIFLLFAPKGFQLFFLLKIGVRKSSSHAPSEKLVHRCFALMLLPSTILFSHDLASVFPSCFWLDMPPCVLSEERVAPFQSQHFQGLRFPSPSAVLGRCSKERLLLLSSAPLALCDCSVVERSPGTTCRLVLSNPPLSAASRANPRPVPAPPLSGLNGLLRTAFLFADSRFFFFYCSSPRAVSFPLRLPEIRLFPNLQPMTIVFFPSRESSPMLLAQVSKYTNLSFMVPLFFIFSECLPQTLLGGRFFGDLASPAPPLILLGN